MQHLVDSGKAPVGRYGLYHLPEYVREQFHLESSTIFPIEDADKRLITGYLSRGQTSTPLKIE